MTVLEQQSADEGSLSLEWALMTPMIFMLLSLVYVFARMATVNGVLDNGTRDAARAATRASSHAEAQSAAESVIKDEVGTGSTSCLANLAVVVTPESFTQPTPEPAAGAEPVTVTVKATCTYALKDDSWLPNMPGTLTVSSTFSSLLDPNRTLH